MREQQSENLSRLRLQANWNALAAEFMG